MNKNSSFHKNVSWANRENHEDDSEYNLSHIKDEDGKYFKEEHSNRENEGQKIPREIDKKNEKLNKKLLSIFQSLIDTAKREVNLNIK